MPQLDRHPREPAIFLQSFELAKFILQATPLFPKPTRYVLGNKLEQCSLDFLLQLSNVIGPSGVRYLSAENRVQTLKALSKHLDQLRILLRMAREVGVFSAGHYQQLAEQCNAIGRQIGGLLKQSQKREDT